MNGCDGGDEGEPEPEEDVDLLVDDVQRKHAKAVELLLAGSGTDAVKCTTKKKYKNVLIVIMKHSLPHCDSKVEFRSLCHTDVAFKMIFFTVYCNIELLESQPFFGLNA